MDMVRCMLKSKNLSKLFWVEAVACAVYVLNSCSSKSVHDKTPQEVWTDQKPKVEHFRVFGCITYAHVPNAMIKKLDDRVEKCIFIGYSNMTKSYKLFNPKSGKVIINCDSTFDEKGIWDWSDKGKKHMSVELNDEEQVKDQKVQKINELILPVTSPTQEKSSSHPQHQRVLSTCLHDYVLSDNNVPDEEIMNYVLFVGCDPVNFEEAPHDER